MNIHITHYQAIAFFPKLAPGFALGLRCNDEHILSIEFLAPCPEIKPRNLLAREAVRQLRGYLCDFHSQFDLPLAPAGTPFQRCVWQQIAAIPPGQTRFYADLAHAIGNSPRAVGGACGANPYPIVVPCHRVVAANGGLGGFARHRDGLLLEIKRWLLQHEQS